MTQIITLCIFAFLAGLIDSIVGGGGLIQLPALLVLLPNTAIPLIMGTGKLSSLAGTSVAAIRFYKAVPISSLIVIIAAIAAFIFSFIGAKTVSIIHPDIIRPIILLVLIVVAIYTFFKKDFGVQYFFKPQERKQLISAAIIGCLLGFYDGFLGPGTGSFLIFAFISILGFDFLRASAAAKVVNFATNFSALIYFAFTNNVIYHLALPMAISNMVGASIGSQLAIAKGSSFIRIIFMIVVSILITKLAYDIFFSKS